MDWNGAVALVTGASSGIGEGFARELARRGCRVVLVARREERLSALADELRTQGAPPPVVMVMDLAVDGAPQELKRRTDEMGLEVDVLVNNAGHSLQGPIHEVSPEDQDRMLRLNVCALAAVTGLYLPGMRSRGRGAIVNVASIASFHPIPTQAAYAASKAFVLSFTESLWEESRGSGVRVLAVCPGATATEFFQRLGRDLKVPKHAPSLVVDAALRALERDRMTVVVGLLNAFRSRFLPRITPRKLAVRVSGGIMRQAYVD